MAYVMTKDDILGIYQDTMAKEIQLRYTHRSKTFERLTGAHYVPRLEEMYGISMVPRSKEIYNIVWRIFEIAKSSTVSRSYNLSYNLTDADFMFESVGAHTNLVVEIVTEALDYQYGGVNRFICTSEGYSYRDIIEAVRLHDLPENETGDLPDNGSRDESEKLSLEAEYLVKYLDTYPRYNNNARPRNLRKNVEKLLASMGHQDSPTGRLIYLSDKIAALLITLCLDSLGMSPMILEDSDYASERDRQEMAMCDFCSNFHAHKASEMWAVDFFVMRNLVRFDDDFFFTAILVMATLMVNGKWYSWREKMYEK